MLLLMRLYGGFLPPRKRRNLVKDNAGYKFSFKEIYILGNEEMWKAEMETKAAGQSQPLSLGSARRSFGPQSWKNKDWTTISIYPYLIDPFF